tara:strand:+ start:214 stop:480 length:267 start_codon:yes stop_codon:yes gene_type:complete
MTKTPITDAVPHNVAELAILCRKLEAIRQAAEQSTDFYRVKERCEAWQACAERLAHELGYCKFYMAVGDFRADGDLALAAFDKLKGTK